MFSLAGTIQNNELCAAAPCISLSIFNQHSITEENSSDAFVCYFRIEFQTIDFTIRKRDERVNALGDFFHCCMYNARLNDDYVEQKAELYSGLVMNEYLAR